MYNMSDYDNYFRRLAFGSSESSINQLKENELARQTNPLNLEETGIQEQINNLTGDDAIRGKTESAVTTIGDATGLSLESADYLSNQQNIMS